MEGSGAARGRPGPYLASCPACLPACLGGTHHPCACSSLAISSSKLRPPELLRNAQQTRCHTNDGIGGERAEAAQCAAWCGAASVAKCPTCETKS